jgi:hypothetical protein
MLPHRQTALASLWRAFFFPALCVTTAFSAAPPARPPDLAQVGLPDAAEVREILQQFRRADVVGDYYLEFELHALPRRGEETVFRGRLWGARNATGPIVRVELVDAAGAVRRLLVQNGERAAVWRFANGRIEQLGTAALFEPVIPGSELTAFDIQRPYLYWPDATLEKLVRVGGRPAHAFVFRAPSGFVAQHPEVAAVRAYLDTQFNALVQAELLDAKSKAVKTMSLLALKKVGEQWIPKAIDWRNAQTGDKARFVVTGAALNLEFGPALFEPAKLTEAIPPPAPDRIVRVEP